MSWIIHFLGHQQPTSECWLCFQLELPPDAYPGRWQMMAQVVGSMSPMCRVWIELLAPGCQCRRHLGNEPVDGRDSSSTASLPSSPSIPLSFQICIFKKNYLYNVFTKDKGHFVMRFVSRRHVSPISLGANRKYPFIKTCPYCDQMVSMWDKEGWLNIQNAVNVIHRKLLKKNYIMAVWLEKNISQYPRRILYKPVIERPSPVYEAHSSYHLQW